MPTHIVKFDRPLTGAVLAIHRPAATTHAPISHASPVELSEPGETESQAPAKSMDPNTDLLAVLEEIRKNTEVIRQHQNETLRQFQELVIRLSGQIARAVVFHDVSHHESRIQSLLESCLQRFEPEHPVTVRINKSDLDRLLNSSPDAPSFGSDIHFIDEDSIKPGDCQVESNGRAVVACLERQLDDIQEQLMEALEDARTERTDIE